jgi:hypothetical protein
VNGTQFGVRLDIRSQEAPSLVVSLSNVVADPALHVGSALTASVSLVGQVIALSRVEQQALARFTNDAGDHVAVVASQQAQ